MTATRIIDIAAVAPTPILANPACITTAADIIPALTVFPTDAMPILIAFVTPSIPAVTDIITIVMLVDADAPIIANPICIADLALFIPVITALTRPVIAPAIAVPRTLNDMDDPRALVANVVKAVLALFIPVVNADTPVEIDDIFVLSVAIDVPAVINDIVNDVITAIAAVDAPTNC